MNITMNGWLLLALVVVTLMALLWGMSRRPETIVNDVADPRKQLDFVSRVEFEARPLLNKSEFEVLLILEAVARDVRAGHRVMAQTCFGEFLRPKRKSAGEDADKAYRSINSKRADFVIVDPKGYPVVVVEYQGTGHYQGTASLRDAVKKEACRTAGIVLLEIEAKFDSADVSQTVRRALLTGVKGAVQLH